MKSAYSLSKKLNIKITFLPLIIWFLSCSFYLYKYFLEVSPSVMGNELMRKFKITGAQLGNLTAFYFYAYLIMQIPMGSLVDRFGARLVTTISISMCALGTFLLAKSESLYLAELGRFITGAGAAVSSISCMKLIALWFNSERFALMTGLMLTFGMIGAIIGQAPLSEIINILGWKNTLFLTAFLGFLLAIIFWVIVRDKKDDFLPLTALSLKNLSLKYQLLLILKNPQVWLLSIYSGFTFAPVAVFGGLWGVPYLEAIYGMERTAAAEAISFIFFGFSIGCPFFGWLSDYIGSRLKVIKYGTLAALLTLILALYGYFPSPYWLYLVLFAFGFFIGTFLLCFSMVREINPVMFAATALSFMNAFDALLGAVSDPLIGYFLDKNWDGKIDNGVRIFSSVNYHYALSILLLYLIIALLLLPFIKETLKPRFRKKSKLLLGSESNQ